LEESGLVTTGISLVEEHARKIKPPRMLSVPFNFGNTLGEANNPSYQHEILAATFDLLNRSEGPVLQIFETDEIERVVISRTESKIESITEKKDLLLELSDIKPDYEKALKTNKGRTAVGLSTINPGLFPDVMEFLKRYAAGEMEDSEMRPERFSIGHFVRYCVDDLKSYYLESRIAVEPEASMNELYRWLWSDTSLGDLLGELADVMNNSEDKEVKAIAYGVAR
jgi:hypothetical protein|tara:strand:+ start:1474 stop:2148 length:675 start_codon:yes stop_codon:yes gene_type:complete